MPVAENAWDGRVRIYRTPVGSAGGPKNTQDFWLQKKTLEGTIFTQVLQWWNNN